MWHDLSYLCLSRVLLSKINRLEGLLSRFTWRLQWNDLSYFCPLRVLPSKLNRLEGLLSRFMRTLQWNDLSYFCPLIVLLNKLLRFLRPSSYPNARRCLEGWRPSRWIWRPCEAAISCIVSLKKCLCLFYSTALRYQRKGKELECLFTKLRYPTS